MNRSKSCTKTFIYFNFNWNACTFVMNLFNNNMFSIEKWNDRSLFILLILYRCREIKFSVFIKNKHFNCLHLWFFFHILSIKKIFFCHFAVCRWNIPISLNIWYFMSVFLQISNVILMMMILLKIVIFFFFWTVFMMKG